MGLFGLLVACGGVSERQGRRPAPPDAGGEDATDGAQCAAPDPVGDAVYDGSVEITDPSDAAAILSFAEITGTLSVRPPFTGVLELPNLRRLGGDLFVEGSSGEPPVPDHVTELRLPNLERIDGQLWIYLAWNLVAVDLHELETVGSRFWIHRNIELRTLRLDSLSEIGADVQVSGNLSLPSCMTDPIMPIASLAFANGGTSCWCEAVCEHLEGRCD